MEITANELKKKMDNHEEFVLIDVRELYEYEEFNLGGEHIPLASVMGEMSRFKKDEEIVIHCAAGKKSAVALMLFQNAGFSNVSHLVGGVKAWKSEFGVDGD